MPLSSTTWQFEIALVALQGFQVLFLWIHDWVPIGSLNDVPAVRGADSKQRLVVVTLIQNAPFIVGLLFSLLDFGRRYPHWLYTWLWISYGLLLLGQICAALLQYGMRFAAAQTMPSVQLTLDTSEAEQALQILDKEAAHQAITPEDWQKLFATMSYQ